jgi:pimeloyl-ACP methyl ester carboxylesterase
MPKLRTDTGVNLHYYLRPGRRLLVMLHGLATNLAFWFVTVLPILRREHGVLLMDLRGHGQSDMPPSGYTTAHMVQDLHALLDALDVTKAHLVGHSHGAVVALQYTTLHPERILSLTLADARIPPLQPRLRLHDWPKLPRVQEALERLGVSDGPGLELAFLERLAEAPRQRLAARRRQDRAMAPEDFSPFAIGAGRDRTARQWLQLLRSTTAREELQDSTSLTVEQIKDVRRPVLAAFGEYSPCLPSCRALAQLLPDCRVVIVPRAGHFHPIVRPRIFALTLSTFVEGVARSA